MSDILWVLWDVSAKEPVEVGYALVALPTDAPPLNDKVYQEIGLSRLPPSVEEWLLKDHGIDVIESKGGWVRRAPY